MKDNIKLCFLALGAYPLLVGESPKYIIGPDVHQVILGKELKNYGFNVSFIVYSNKESKIEYIDGMTIIKVNISDKLFFEKFIKLRRIWQAMKIADSDVYFHTGGIPGVVSLFCMFNRKKFIYEIASDAKVDRNVITKKNRQYSRSALSLDNIFGLLDIKLSHLIIVQSEVQKKLLLDNFQRDGEVIKMIFPFPQNYKINKSDPKIILWVGSMSEVKQPLLFLELARLLPDYKFQMIGGNTGDHNLSEQINNFSKSLPNVDLFGVVPFHEISQYFNDAAILVNTSIFEGFPNAFIQAWMHAVPVVSLNANPDNLLTIHNMGVHSKTFDRLIIDLKMLVDNEKLRCELGINGRTYVENEHNFNHIIRKYVDLFSFYGGMTNRK